MNAADQSQPLPWKAVSEHPDFQNADWQTRQKMRNNYVERVVQPLARSEADFFKVRDQFFTATESDVFGERTRRQRTRLSASDSLNAGYGGGLAEQRAIDERDTSDYEPAKQNLDFPEAEEQEGRTAGGWGLNLARGVAEGALGSVAAAAEGAGLIGEQAGNVEANRQVDDAIKRLETTQQQYEAALEGASDAYRERVEGNYQRLIDARENELHEAMTDWAEREPSKVAQWLQDRGVDLRDAAQSVGPDDEYRGVATDVAGGLGSMLTYMGPGLVAGALTRGSLAAAMGTAVGMAGPSGVSEQYQRAIAGGLDEEQALEKSMQGFAGGAIQVAPLAAMIRPLPAELQGKAIGQLYGLMRAAGSEAIVEGAGGVLQNLIEQSYNPERGTWDDTAYQAAISGGSAGLLQAGVQVATRGRGMSAGASQRREAEEVAPQQPTTENSDGNAEWEAAWREQAAEDGITDFDPNANIPDTTIDVEGQQAEAATAETPQADAEQQAPDQPVSAVPQEDDAGARLIRSPAEQLSPPEQRARERLLSGDGYAYLRERAEGNEDAVAAVDRMQVLANEGDADGAADAYKQARQLLQPVEQSAPAEQAVSADSQEVAPGPIAQEVASQEALPEAAQPESALAPDQPSPNPERMTPRRVPVADIQVDPDAYQFRSNVNQEGVDSRLEGVERWDDLRAGNLVLHERLDGTLFAADGHHRINLARQLEQPDVNALVLREADGVTVEDARIEAATANIAAGSATAMDAAKVFRNTNVKPAEAINRFDLPRTSPLVRDGIDIAKLANDAFGAVLNGVVTEKDGATIGRAFADPDQQMAAIGVFQRVKPTNENQRALLANEVRQAGFAESQGEQGGLFGEDPAESLIGERVRVMDSLRQSLVRDRRFFATLNENSQTAEQAGNRIAKDRNNALQDASAEAVALLERATTTPDINQQINDAARRVKGGETLASVTRELKDALLNGPDTRAAEQSRAPTPSDGQIAQRGLEQRADNPVPERDDARAASANEQRVGDDAGQSQGGVTLKADGQPFQTRRAVELSKRFRDTPNAQPVEVGGGWGFAVQDVANSQQENESTGRIQLTPASPKDFDLYGWRQPRGGEGQVFSIGRNGEELGFADMAFFPGGEARIVDIVSNDGVGSIGTTEMRSLLRELRRIRPDIKRITGERVSGARRGGRHGFSGTGQEVAVNLPQDNTESLRLETQTEESLVQREQQTQQADQAEAQQRATEEQRAKADRDRDDFTLSGSDRSADIAASRGQDALFSLAENRASAQFTDSAEFKSWFGDSPNVNSDGTPIVFYHGGSADFTSIRRGRFGEGIFVREGAPSGYGEAQHALYLRSPILELSDLEIYMDTESGRAAVEAEIIGADEGTVDLVVEALSSDESYPDNPSVWEAINAIDEADAAIEIQALRGRVAKRLGYDAVRQPDEFDGESVMVLDSSAIKSATGNSGDFDATNPDIRYAINTEAENVNQAPSAADITAALADTPELSDTRIIQSTAELPPQALLGMMLRGVNPTDVRGMFIGDELYVIADNVTSVEEGVQTAIHEAVGHKGIRGVLGSELEPVMRQVYESLPRDPRGREALNEVLESYPFLDQTNPEHQITIAEEMVAHLTEKGWQPNVIRRAVAKIRELLRRYFPSMNWTDTDVMRLSERSREYLRRQQQESEGAGDVEIGFSLSNRGETATATEVQSGLSDVSGIGRPIVLESADNLALDIALESTIAGVNPQDAIAFYHGDDLYVVASNAADTAEAVRATLSTVVGHKGLRSTLGNRVDSTLGQVVTQAQQSIVGRETLRAIRAEYGHLDVSHTPDQVNMGAELVARMSDLSDPPGFIQEANAKLDDLLQRAYPDAGFTPGDGRNMARQNRHHLQQQQRDFGEGKPPYSLPYVFSAQDGPGRGTLLDMNTQVVDENGDIVSDARIDGPFKSAAKFGQGFFESGTDRLRRSNSPVLQELAKRVDAYFDQSEARLGMVNGILREPLKRLRTLNPFERSRNMRDFESYMRHRDNGRDAEAQAVADSNAAVAELAEAVDTMFDQVGTINQTVKTPQGTGMRVFDSKTGAYRKIGKFKKGGFWPRAVRPEVQRVMHDPTSNNKLWHELLDALIDDGRATNRKEAAEYLRGNSGYFSGEITSDYFAGIEKARGEKLPEMFYDYRFDVVSNYARKWSDRISQVEQFGQKIGPMGKDAFEEAASVARDQRTKDYIGWLADRAYNRRPTDAYHELMANANLAATGLQLGNPGTATLNIIGGTQLNVQMFGSKRMAKAYLDLAMDAKNIYREGVELGILGKDVLNILRDADNRNAEYMDANSKTKEMLGKFSAFTMKWGGYTGTEQVIRATGMIAARAQLMDALHAWNKRPHSRDARAYRKFMERNRIDVSKLLRENGKGEETGRYLRLMVNIPQGSYRVDMTPLYVDTPMGRFFFKYQKFGTQVSRLFWQQKLKPFMDTVGDPNATAMDRAQAFLPIMQWFGWAVLGGGAVLAARGAMFGYIDPGPELDEIAKALEDDDKAAAWGLMASKAHANLIAGSAYGFFGNYIQMAKDVADQQRVKNPFEPPGLAPVDSIIELVRRGLEQGRFPYAEDFDQVINRNFSLYRTSKRGLAAIGNQAGFEAEFMQLEQARRDLQYIRKAARRFASESGIDATRTATGRFGLTENTAENREIVNAIMIGDGARAAALVEAALDATQTREEEMRRKQSIRSVVRARHPVQLGGPASQEEIDMFLEWAEDRLPASRARFVMEAVERYDDTAWRAGL